RRSQRRENLLTDDRARGKSGRQEHLPSVPVELARDRIARALQHLNQREGEKDAAEIEVKRSVVGLTPVAEKMPELPERLEDHAVVRKVKAQNAGREKQAALHASPDSAGAGAPFAAKEGRLLEVVRPSPKEARAETAPTLARLFASLAHQNRCQPPA